MVLPFGNERYHRVRCIGIKFGGIGIGKPHNVARKFNRRDLHAETNAEIRNFVFAREFDSSYLALGTALAEPARHQNGIHVGQCRHTVFLDLL